MASGHFKKTLLAGAAAFLYGTGAYAQDVCDIPGIESADTVSVTGGVKDQRTGANLKGALVEIEETGQKSSTDDLGNFRFSSVKPGCYTLRISYLGYRDIEASIRVEPGRRYDDTFAMVGGSTTDVVVVYGSRSARAQALNQERTAENVSTVISGDLLGDFTGTTLSESLRRAPGVTFDRDPNTGDGTNINVRGVAPDLNTVKLNGVELPEGSGTGRSASLSNILTESISKVTISKTLLPNQDSSGTGGLVEIETKTPLDRPHRYASFTLEGAKRFNDFNKEFLTAGTVSGTFGANEQFGLSASVQYRDRQVNQVNYSTLFQFGQYLPLQVDGTTGITSILDVDPRLRFPFESNANEVYPRSVTIGQEATDTENFSATISTAYAIANHTKLFADIQYLDQKDQKYRTSQDPIASLGYSLYPIASLNGELRNSLEWQFGQFLYSTQSFKFTPENRLKSVIFSFRGDTNFNEWTIRYGAGYGTGRRNTNTWSLSAYQFATLDSSYLLPEAIHSIEGRILSPFGNREPGDNSVPELLLTPEGVNLINSAENHFAYDTGYLRETGNNKRYTGDFSLRYTADASSLKYLEVGFNLEKSIFKDATPENLGYFLLAPLSLSELGLSLDDGLLSDIGIDYNLGSINRIDAEQFTRTDLAADERFELFDSSGDPLLLDEFTKETEIAGYLQGALEFGKIELVGGVRASHVRISSVNLSGPRIFMANF